jgi:tRNA (mo5U34)-methyltransferase
MTEASGAGEALRREIAALRWFHKIDLGHGIVTPGYVDTFRFLPWLRLPESLSGKTVLATDSYSWGGGGWGTKAGFDLARRPMGSRVESRVIDVLELSPDNVGTFDVVLFLGVLYHMRHPMLALETVFGVTREMAVVETHAVLRSGDPALTFYRGGELDGDETNWFGPNPRAVEEMLRAVGFSRVERVFAGPAFGERLLVAANRALRGRGPFLRLLRHGRVVYHAYR